MLGKFERGKSFLFLWVQYRGSWFSLYFKTNLYNVEDAGEIEEITHNKNEEDDNQYEDLIEYITMEELKKRQENERLKIGFKISKIIMNYFFLFAKVSRYNIKPLSDSNW